jgi:hypothetical protein
VVVDKYEAMKMVGYRDDKECFLVDFEQKRWQVNRFLPTHTHTPAPTHTHTHSPYHYVSACS